MPEQSIRRLALADLDNTLVDRLIGARETLMVERKAQLPSDGLGPTISSFANTLGGWLLLGVTNDGAIEGWKPPGRAEPQDWIRDTLRREVDPMPPFAAAAIERDGKPIAVVRVAESFDTPHLVASTGAVYIREPGGKRPITDHRTLIELARRGDRARALAQDRQRGLGLIADAMDAPATIYGDERFNETRAVIEWIVYATPLTVTAEFSDRAISQRTVDTAGERLAHLFPGPHEPPMHVGVRPEPRARGMVFTATKLGTNALADMAIDSGGVIAVRYAWRSNRGVFHLDHFAKDTLQPLTRIAADTLEDLNGLGRALVSVYLRCPGPLTISAGPNQIAEYTPDPVGLWIGGELPIPAQDDDLLDHASRTLREVARAAGLPRWEP